VSEGLESTIDASADCRKLSRRWLDDGLMEDAFWPVARAALPPASKAGPSSAGVGISRAGVESLTGVGSAPAKPCALA